MGWAHRSAACRKWSSQPPSMLKTLVHDPAWGRPFVSLPTASRGGLLVRTELLCPRISDSRPAVSCSSVLHLSRVRGSKEGKGIVYNNAYDR